MHQLNHLVMVDLHPKMNMNQTSQVDSFCLLDEKQVDEKYFPRRDHCVDHDEIDYHRELIHLDLSTRINEE